MSITALLKHQIGTTKNGKPVYAYLTQQPLAALVSRNPHLLTLVKEIMPLHSLRQAAERVQHDMGRSIGYGDLVEVQDKDAVFYAKQLRQDSYTKFVKNRRADQTSILTVKLGRDEAGDYEVLSVHLGEDYPAIPGDAGETAASQAFWQDHAVVFNGQAIVASSLTRDCPY
jgi:hypothetical protein